MAFCLASCQIHIKVELAVENKSNIVFYKRLQSYFNRQIQLFLKQLNQEIESTSRLSWLKNFQILKFNYLECEKCEKRESWKELKQEKCWGPFFNTKKLLCWNVSYQIFSEKLFLFE